MNFSFGSKPPTTSTATTVAFSFGSGDAANKNAFGAAPTAPTQATGFALGGAITTTAPSFGTPSFGFATATTTVAQPTLGFSFAPAKPAQVTSTTAGVGDSTSQSPASIPAPTAPISFGATVIAPKTSSTTGFALGAPTTSIPSSNLSFAPSSTTATLSFGSNTPSGFSLGSIASSTSSALTLGKTQPSIISTSTNVIPSSAPPSILSLPTTASTTSVTPTTTTIAVADAIVSATGALNFNELEEAINKWTVELEEQEKVFMNQALQLNAWDRLLIANGDKVLELNSIVERVKQEQQQLDHELDFIVAQQRELEECISPLEKELATLPVVDPDRQHTYQLAENIDSQLKQMSEDLKEIIEHLNETSRTEDVNDPIVQIGRILNAHMNSLEWIDRNTALISSHLDEVTKLHETHRREHEKTFHLTF